MKALKEKRVSLRSLFRRSLVILSLFALVFASCSDSGGDGTDVVTPGGPALMRVDIIKHPAQAASEAAANGASAAELETYLSYEGLPVNLKGLRAVARYSSGSQDDKILTPDNASFYTYPPYAVGIIGTEFGGTPTDLIWKPMRQYDLMLDVGGVPTKLGTVTIPDVMPITRSTTWRLDGWNPSTGLGNGLPFDTNDETFWQQGLDLNFPLSEEMYVDDYPDLSKAKLQGHYVNSKNKDIPVNWNTPWVLRPLYDNGNETGTGVFVLIVGENPLIANPLDFATEAANLHPYVKAALGADLWPTTTSGIVSADPGIYKSKSIEKMYHVKKNGIELLDTTLDDFFYWEDDTSQAWTNRLIAKNAKVRITYSNESTKEFTVEHAVNNNKIWHNPAGANSQFQEEPFGVYGISETAQRTSTTGSGLLAHARNRDPKIRIDYRGGVLDIKVPVFTRLVSIDITPKSGEQIMVDMRSRDNDVGGMNATEFSKLVDVVATFSAYSDSTLQAKKTLKFDETRYTDLAGPVPYDLSGTMEKHGIGADYYSMDFGKPSWFGRRKDDTSLPEDWYGGNGDSDPATTGGWSSTYTNIVYPPYRNVPSSGITSGDKRADGSRILTLTELEAIPAYGTCDSPRNNGREVAIRFYYKPPEGEGSETDPESELARWGIETTTARNNRLTVGWTNIRQR